MSTRSISVLTIALLLAACDGGMREPRADLTGIFVVRSPRFQQTNLPYIKDDISVIGWVDYDWTVTHTATISQTGNQVQVRLEHLLEGVSGRRVVGRQDYTVPTRWEGTIEHIYHGTYDPGIGALGAQTEGGLQMSGEATDRRLTLSLQNPFPAYYKLKSVTSGTATLMSSHFSPDPFILTFDF